MCDSQSVSLNVSLCCVQGGLYAAGHERATHRLGEMKALEDLPAINLHSGCRQVQHTFRVPRDLGRIAS